jgi:hypothetical protein
MEQWPNHVVAEPAVELAVDVLRHIDRSEGEVESGLGGRLLVGAGSFSFSNPHEIPAERPGVRPS